MKCQTQKHFSIPTSANIVVRSAPERGRAIHLPVSCRQSRVLLLLVVVPGGVRDKRNTVSSRTKLCRPIKRKRRRGHNSRRGTQRSRDERETTILSLKIRTARLELIAANKELFQSESDLSQLARGLEAEVPSNWPPPLYDDDARQHFLGIVSRSSEAIGWTAWYILLFDSADRKTLIGGVGACGLPDDNGAIVIGYSLLDQFHGKGYATEALRGFLEWTRRHPGLRKVVADTFPHLTASMRVLEKCGFVPCGSGTEEGTIQFELSVR
jgi:[ribosomal protein S5]-alanine N-acetyltransferase